MKFEDALRPKLRKVVLRMNKVVKLEILVLNHKIIA